MRNRNLQNYIGHMYYRIFNIFTLPAACKNHPEPVLEMRALQAGLLQLATGIKALLF
jgi:hypothetical protein